MQPEGSELTNGRASGHAKLTILSFLSRFLVVLSWHGLLFVCVGVCVWGDLHAFVLLSVPPAVP